MLLKCLVYLIVLIIVISAIFCQHKLNKYIKGMYRTISSGAHVTKNWSKEIILTANLIFSGLCIAIIILIVYTIF